jgi:hypothetical protein
VLCNLCDRLTFKLARVGLNRGSWHGLKCRDYIALYVSTERPAYTCTVSHKTGAVRGAPDHA